MLLADWQIKSMVNSHGMIKPFSPAKVMVEREIPELGGVVKLPSYGLEPHGYTFRLNPEGIIVAERKTKRNLEGGDIELEVKENTDYILLPPQGILLGKSLEYFSMPNFLVGLLVGKSTYTRQGVAFLGTVLDAGWEGHIHFSVVNLSNKDVPIFVGFGIGQVLFLGGDVPEKVYQGYYNGQR